MASEYIPMPLNTSLKGWNARWFSMKQVDSTVRCDVDQILENQRGWSKKPTSANMEQMKELLELIRGMKMSRVVVAVNFILRHI